MPLYCVVRAACFLRRVCCVSVASDVRGEHAGRSAQEIRSTQDAGRYASCNSLASFDDSVITFCATSGGICS
jgi:hypothetical protein